MKVFYSVLITVVFLSVLYVSFAAAAPSATIYIPTGNITVSQGTPVSFSGAGVADTNSMGARTDYVVESSPYGVAFDPVTNSMWVANLSSSTVSKVNVNNGSRIDYAVGELPVDVAFDPVTNSVWVTNDGSRTFSKVNINTGARTDYGTTGAGDQPQGIAFDPVTKSMWIALPYASLVIKYNVTTGARVTYTAGDGSVGVAFDSATNSIWTTNHDASTVSKFNVNTGARVDYAVGSSPKGIAFDPVTNSVWVTNMGSNTVSKVNVNTGTRSDYPVPGNNPYDVAFDPTTNSVWVTSPDSDTLSKVDVFTGERIDYVVGDYPHEITFEPSTNSLWVSNANAGTVSKIGTGANSIVAYEWHEGNCSTGTLLYSASSFNLATPTVGARTIYLRVKDSYGTWSNNCPSRVVTVNAPAVNGACGASHQGTFSVRPTTGLCSAGTPQPSPVTGGTNGPWYWDCVGSGGGATASCSAFTSVIPGSCGSANGVSSPTAPTTNLCTQTSSAPTVTGTSNAWNWTCFGANGAADASCSAPKSIICGDGMCQTGETFLTCPKDCKSQYQQF